MQSRTNSLASIDDIRIISPTALGRETSQHDYQAKTGDLLAKTQTNIG